MQPLRKPAALVHSLTLTACLGAPGIAFAGDLNPAPGPIAPTHKTLTEIEPRIAISAANTPGDADSMFRTTQPRPYNAAEGYYLFPASSISFCVSNAAAAAGISMFNECMADHCTSIGNTCASNGSGASDGDSDGWAGIANANHPWAHFGH